MEIEFTVAGTPISQGSKSCFCKGGKAIIAETGGARHKKWRKIISEAAYKIKEDSNWEPLDGPVGMELKFYLVKPASKKAWKVWCDVKPDLDKLTRAVLDGIDHHIMTTDSRVVRILAEKVYVTEEHGEGVDIRAYSIEDKPLTLFEE